MAVYRNGHRVGGDGGAGSITQAQLNAALALKADQTALQTLETEVDAIGIPVYRDAIDGVVAASLARRKSIRIDESGNEYVVEPQDNPATDATGTWNEYTNTNFEGSHSGQPYVRGATGHFFYDINHHHFYRADPSGAFVRWVQVSDATALGANAEMLGEFDTETDASNAISSYDSTKTYYAYFNHEVRVLDGSTYVAAQGESQTPEWSRVGHAEADRIDNLEAQTLQQHTFEENDRIITGNGSEVFSFDVSMIRRFLNDARAFASVNLEFSFQPSVALNPAEIDFSLDDGGTNLRNQTVVFSSSTAQNNFTFTVTITSLSSDTLTFTATTSGITDATATVTLSNIELAVTNGFAPTRAQILDILSATQAQLDSIFIGWSISNQRITANQLGGGTSVIDLPDDDGTEVFVQSTAPDNPTLGDLLLFDADVSALPSGFRRSDGVAITSARNGDLFRRRQLSGTAQWVYVTFLGDRITADGRVESASVSGSLLRLHRSNNLHDVTVSLLLLEDEVPVHERIHVNNQVIGGDDAADSSINVTDLRQFLGFGNRGHAQLRVSFSVERIDADNTAGDITVSLRDGSTELGTVSINNVVGNTEYDRTFSVDITSLDNDSLTLRIITANTPTGNSWNLTDFNVDVLSGFASDSEVADGVLTNVTRNGTVVSWARSNGLPALTLDFAEILPAASGVPIFRRYARPSTQVAPPQAEHILRIPGLGEFLSSNGRAQATIRATVRINSKVSSGASDTITPSLREGSTTIDSLSALSSTPTNVLLTGTITALSAANTDDSIRVLLVPSAGSQWTASVMIEVTMRYADDVLDDGSFTGGELSLERTNGLDDVIIAINNVLNARASLPDATNQLLVNVALDDHGNIRVVEPSRNATTAAQGTWNIYTADDWAGVFHTVPYGTPVDRYYYDPNNHQFHEIARTSDGRGRRYIQVAVAQALGDDAEMLGEFNSESEALHAISNFDATTDYFAYFDGEIRQLDNAGYTAPTGLNTDYLWRRIGEDESRRLAALERNTGVRTRFEDETVRLDGNETKDVVFDLSQHRAVIDNIRGVGQFIMEYTVEKTTGTGSNGTVTGELRNGANALGNASEGPLAASTPQTETITVDVSSMTNDDVVLRFTSASGDSGNVYEISSISLEAIVSYVPSSGGGGGPTFIPDSGVANPSDNVNVIDLTPTPAITSHGQAFWFRVPATNTAAVFVNISGLGNVTLTKKDGSAFASGELPDNEYILIFYNGSSYISDVVELDLDVSEQDLLNAVHGTPAAGQRPTYDADNTRMQWESPIVPFATNPISTWRKGAPPLAVAYFNPFAQSIDIANVDSSGVNQNTALDAVPNGRAFRFNVDTTEAIFLVTGAVDLISPAFGRRFTGRWLEGDQDTFASNAVVTVSLTDHDVRLAERWLAARDITADWETLWFNDSGITHNNDITITAAGVTFNDFRYLVIEYSHAQAERKFMLFLRERWMHEVDDATNGASRIACHTEAQWMLVQARASSTQMHRVFRKHSGGSNMRIFGMYGIL